MSTVAGTIDSHHHGLGLFTYCTHVFIPQTTVNWVLGLWFIKQQGFVKGLLCASINAGVELKCKDCTHTVYIVRDNKQAIYSTTLNNDKNVSEEESRPRKSVQISSLSSELCHGGQTIQNGRIHFKNQSIYCINYVLENTTPFALFTE